MALCKDPHKRACMNPVLADGMVCRTCEATEHRLTVVIERLGDTLMVSTEGLPSGNWNRRNVRDREQFVRALDALSAATASGAIDPLLTLGR